MNSTAAATSSIFWSYMYIVGWTYGPSDQCRPSMQAAMDEAGCWLAHRVLFLSCPPYGHRPPTVSRMPATALPRREVFPACAVPCVPHLCIGCALHYARTYRCALLFHVRPGKMVRWMQMWLIISLLIGRVSWWLAAPLWLWPPEIIPCFFFFVSLVYTTFMWI